MTTKDIYRRLNLIDGLDKKALKDEYSESFQPENFKRDQPHVLYTNQINIEQL